MFSRFLRHDRASRFSPAGFAAGEGGLLRSGQSAKQRLSARYYAWVYALISVIAWAGGLYLLAQKHDEVRVQIERRALDVARLSAEQTRITLGNAIAGVGALADRLRISDWWVVGDAFSTARRPPLLARSLEQMEQGSVVPIRFAIADRLGTVRVWGQGLDAPLVNVPPALLRVLQEEKADRLIIRLMPGGYSDGSPWRLLMAQRFLLPDGTFGGVALAILDSMAARSVFDTVVLGPDDRLLVVGPDHQVIISRLGEKPQAGVALSLMTPESSIAVGPLAVGDTAPDGLAPEEGNREKVALAFDHLGKMRLLASTRIPALGMVSVVDVNLNDAMAEWRKQTAWAIGVSGALFLLLTVAVFTMLRQMREIAERNAALQETQDRLVTFFEGAQEAIVVSERGYITDVNKAFERMTGLHAEELCGVPLLSLVHPNDVDAAVASLAQEQGSPKRLRARRADGSWLALEVQGQTFSSNTAVRLSTAHDITHIVEQESRLTALVQDLQRSNRDLEQFAYVASHDLQEPLRTIASYVGLLDRRCRPALSDEGREFMDYIVAGALRMQALIRDLLSYSRVGTQGHAMEPKDAGLLVAAAMESLSLTIADAKAEILVEDMPMVIADQAQISRLFQNLLSNALKYRHPDRLPVVSITAEESDKGDNEEGKEKAQWLFRVRDNGIGIAPEFAEQVFVIFQRLHGIGHYEGTGIGLAVARRIVERHGGRIWINTDYQGDGTEVCFTLDGVDYEASALSAAL
jgi:PAS domain S-box-containing protein